MNYLLLIAGIGLLVYDAILEIADRTTISRWYQALYPRWIDWIVFVIGMIVLMALPEWIDRRIKVVWAGFWGHITIANKERYNQKE